MKVFFFRWVRHVMTLLGSIIGIITLGIYSPPWGLIGEKWYLDSTDEEFKDK